MPQEDYRLLVFVEREPVRNIAIIHIADAALTEPDPAHPTLHRVVIRTMANNESVFYYKERVRAEEAVTNILEARERVDQCRLALFADINQHLLHPDQRS